MECTTDGRRRASITYTRVKKKGSKVTLGGGDRREAMRGSILFAVNKMGVFGTFRVNSQVRKWGKLNGGPRAVRATAGAGGRIGHQTVLLGGTYRRLREREAGAKIGTRVGK